MLSLQPNTCYISCFIIVEHRNPLEKFLKNDEVEIIKPVNVEVPQKIKEEPKKVKSKSDGGLFEIEVLGPYILSDSERFNHRSSSPEDVKDNTFKAFDDWIAHGPNLPETGLKSREIPEFGEFGLKDANGRHFGYKDGTYEDVCSQDTHKM